MNRQVNSIINRQINRQIKPNIKRVVIIGCATFPRHNGDIIYQRPITNDEIRGFGLDICIHLVDPEFINTIKTHDNDIETNNLCVSVYPIFANKYFDNNPIDIYETVLIYDFTGNSTRNQFANMINKDINLLYNNIIYYPLYCDGIWNPKLFIYNKIEMNPPYNKFINNINPVSIYKHVRTMCNININMKLYESEKKEYNIDIQNLCSFIKAKYFMNPQPEWVNNIDDYKLLFHNNVDEILTQLIKWYIINGGTTELFITSEKNILFALDTIRNFKL